MITPDKIPQIVRATAEDMAGAFFEMNKRSERFRRAYPKAEMYVAFQWPRYVVPAREVLSQMLAMSDERISPFMKAQIYDALTEGVEQQEAATH